MVSREGRIIRENGLTLDDVCECGNKDFVLNNDSVYVCPECGIEYSKNCVIQDNKRYFNQERNYEIDYKNIGSKTLINKKDINNGVKPYFFRLSKINSNKNSSEVSLATNTSLFYCVSSQLGISNNITEYSLKLFSEVVKQKLMKGRYTKDFIASCLFFSAKSNNYLLSFDDIKNKLGCSEYIFRAKKIVKMQVLPKFGIKNTQETIENYIYNACNKLKDSELEKDSIRIYEKIKGKNLSGLNPKGIAAGIIYIASNISNKNLSQSNLSAIFGITETTLRARYKEISNYLKNIENLKK